MRHCRHFPALRLLLLLLLMLLLCKTCTCPGLPGRWTAQPDSGLGKRGRRHGVPASTTTCGVNQAWARRQVGLCSSNIGQTNEKDVGTAAGVPMSRAVEGAALDLTSDRRQ